MGEKIVVGPITQGLKNAVEPFYIDNDAFPTLINAYTWRGRLKRKRGTSFLTRLQRYFDSTNVSYNTGSTTITLDGSGNGNILSGWSLSGSIVLTSVFITGVGNNYDEDGDGVLDTTPGGVASGTINYATGAITIAGQAGNAVSAAFRYYPNLPVMGLPDYQTNNSDDFPLTLAFDTEKSYQIQSTSPYIAYNVSFYKNPSSSGAYVQKTNPTPVSWTGEDYQQIWAASYENALWATNGITVPFTSTAIGMQYKTVSSFAIGAGGPPATLTITITGHGLSVGDWVFFNEFDETIVTGLNFQTGFVTSTPTADTFVVNLPNATVAGASTTGICQYLTNTADAARSCLRFYDGDPTNGNPTSPTLNTAKGWVNFCPPLSYGSASIAGLPSARYYLVGARMIVPFKDRLLFFGPVVQTSSAGSQTYLEDTVIYSQNGVPYYTCSFTGDVRNTSTSFTSLLTPNASTNILFGSNASSFFTDITGYGGFAQNGLNEPILTCEPNQDALILGFQTTKAKLIYTQNDIAPFAFYLINSEFGDSSTFGAIQFDQGVISKGTYGYIVTSQNESKRIDVAIPDEVFQNKLNENGLERVTAFRDYMQEWLYFSYPVNTIDYRFPTRTLQYNYREGTWATFYECYTTYGTFRRRTGDTWLTIGARFPTWEAWNEPWNAGSTTLLQPEVIGGNQQGFILTRDEGTGEGNSLHIESISGSTITSTDHCLNQGDYIIISGAVGTVSSLVNGKVFSVEEVNNNSFKVNPSIAAGTYLGGGVIKRCYVPYVQTRAFPVSWGMSRKTRLGPQQYLLTRTNNGQIQLLIFLSQNYSSAYNVGPVTPAANVDNQSLVYSTVLYTAAESTNLGLTAANVNLQQQTALQSSQLWHRVNTSLIGDTVQLGFTLSDEQMRDSTLSNQFEEIELHGFILDVNPSQMLA